MKKIIIVICLFLNLISKAQEERKFALMMNLAQLPYQCYELNGLIGAPEKKFQFLLSANITGRKINEDLKRNMKEFDTAYMIQGSEKLQGWGTGGQFRIKLMDAGRKAKRNIHLYTGLGFDYYHYKITFYENEYVMDQPPLYHYILAEHKESFQRINPHAQFIFNYTPGMFFLETGIGLGYNRSFIPESVENYRNLHMSIFDYGFTGFSPYFSLRLGFWLY